jgi:hypothetical protein
VDWIKLLTYLEIFLRENKVGVVMYPTPTIVCEVTKEYFPAESLTEAYTKYLMWKKGLRK